MRHNAMKAEDLQNKKSDIIRQIAQAGSFYDLNCDLNNSEVKRLWEKLGPVHLSHKESLLEKVPESIKRLPGKNSSVGAVDSNLDLEYDLCEYSYRFRDSIYGPLCDLFKKHFSNMAELASARDNDIYQLTKHSAKMSKNYRSGNNYDYETKQYLSKKTLDKLCEPIIEEFDSQIIEEANACDNIRAKIRDLSDLAELYGKVDEGDRSMTRKEYEDLRHATRVGLRYEESKKSLSTD